MLKQKAIYVHRHPWALSKSGPISGGFNVIETSCAEQLIVYNFARMSVSLRSDVDFCVLQCPHFVIMFGNRDGSVHILLYFVTVTVLSIFCYVW